MLSIRIVTAGAVLALAVSAAAAQDSDTTGQPGSLLKMLMHSSEAPASEAKTLPQDKPEAKRVAPKPIRTTRHFHHHATRVATATEDPPPTEPVQAPAPTIEQPPTLEPTSWSAQAAIDAAPPSMWPAGNAPLFAGVLDSEPQVAAAEPSSSSDRSAAMPNAVADTRPAPAVAAAAPQDNSGDSRDAWFEEILAALCGALAAGVVAWFLFGGAPQRRYG